MRYILTSNDKPFQLLRFVPRTPENHLTTDGRSYSDAELNGQFNVLLQAERERIEVAEWEAKRGVQYD
jgi:hypothetical protein